MSPAWPNSHGASSVLRSMVVVACWQVVDVAVAAKHVSDAILEARRIGLGRVTKQRGGGGGGGGGRRERECKINPCPRSSDFHPSNMAAKIQILTCRLWLLESDGTVTIGFIFRYTLCTKQTKGCQF